MNVNKKLQRFQQWGKEKMGAEVRTGGTDDFRALETEMNMRHEGLEKMNASMNTYVKSLNKRSEGDAREKHTAIAWLGNAMARHGEDFEDGSKFGECLVGLGQTNERIARFQDSYASSATASWLECLERSLAQMKEYQNARKKLEARRLAYDTSMGKMQKAKSGDYRVEEELRAQKIKYEESAEDVQRRMQDVIESEQENTQQLYAFMEAELNYHDRCREVLLRARRNWPAPMDDSPPTQPPRPRQNSHPLVRVSTNNTSMSNISEDAVEDFAPPAPAFRNGSRTASGSSTPYSSSPLRENPGFDLPLKPSLSRQTTNDQQLPRSRLPSIDPSTVRSATPFRRTRPSTPRADGSADHDEEAYFPSDSLTRSSSPATSVSQGTMSRSTSYSTLESAGAPGAGAPKAKKAPPPPPPSRGTKPPPPPPPMKRSALSSSVVPTV